MIAMGCAVFLLTVFGGLRAGYGRYAGRGVRNACPISARLAWIIQESPVVAWCVYGLYCGIPQASAGGANTILLVFFLMHYANRTFLYPLLLRGGKPTPLYVMLSAFGYCAWNGWLQVQWLCFDHTYPRDWLWDPRFVVGMTLALVGMGVNLHSDHILRNLRKPGETGYKIPRGGAFELVSGANFFGEILEWTGFAVAQWSWPGLAFAVFTFSNIGISIFFSGGHLFLFLYSFDLCFSSNPLPRSYFSHPNRTERVPSSHVVFGKVRRLPKEPPRGDPIRVVIILSLWLAIYSVV